MDLKPFAEMFRPLRDGVSFRFMMRNVACPEFLEREVGACVDQRLTPSRERRNISAKVSDHSTEGTME